MRVFLLLSLVCAVATSLAGEPQLQVTVDQFLGYLQYGYGPMCMLPVLADLDCVLLTSRSEGLPVALIEAAAAPCSHSKNSATTFSQKSCPTRTRLHRTPAPGAPTTCNFRWKAIPLPPMPLELPLRWPSPIPKASCRG